MKRKTDSDFTLIKRMLKKRRCVYTIEYKRILIPEGRYIITLLFGEKDNICGWEVIPQVKEGVSDVI